jgi:hypothetical protein
LGLVRSLRSCRDGKRVSWQEEQGKKASRTNHAKEISPKWGVELERRLRRRNKLANENIGDGLSETKGDSVRENGDIKPVARERLVLKDRPSNAEHLTELSSEGLFAFDLERRLEPVNEDLAWWEEDEGEEDAGDFAETAAKSWPTLVVLCGGCGTRGRGLSAGVLGGVGEEGDGVRWGKGDGNDGGDWGGSALSFDGVEVDVVSEFLEGEVDEGKEGEEVLERIVFLRDESPIGAEFRVDESDLNDVEHGADDADREPDTFDPPYSSLIASRLRVLRWAHDVLLELTERRLEPPDDARDERGTTGRTGENGGLDEGIEEESPVDRHLALRTTERVDEGDGDVGKLVLIEDRRKFGEDGGEVLSEKKGSIHWRRKDEGEGRTWTTRVWVPIMLVGVVVRMRELTWLSNDERSLLKLASRWSEVTPDPSPFARWISLDRTTSLKSHFQTLMLERSVVAFSGAVGARRRRWRERMMWEAAVEPVKCSEMYRSRTGWRGWEGQPRLGMRAKREKRANFEVVEPTVADEGEDVNDTLEDETVHLSTLVGRRDEDAEEGVEDVTEELADFDLRAEPAVEEGCQRRERREVQGREETHRSFVNVSFINSGFGRSCDSHLRRRRSVSFWV